MQRLALALAFGAVLAALLPAPAQFVALGLGIAAIGTGRVVYARRTLPGAARLTGAAAVTVGVIGLLLGLARVGMTVAAIGRIEGMLT
ncbi:MAG: hypothetical protein H6Q90_4323 [Deltaproteobacteria bacterium]|nr:hypothetical protein [Deltaproteobacteria bacterium]